jgi:hypothetical protein
MDSSIKNLTITGVAATSGDTIKPRRKRGLSRKKSLDDIEEEKQDAIEKLDIPVKPIISKIIPAAPIQTISPVAPVAVRQVKVLPAPKEPLFNTGTQKVNLIPPKSPRVKLNPKIIGSDKITQNHVTSQQTRKARRVIVPNLSARFTRAKRLRDETEKSPIDTIRNYLIEKGVIQSKSKAPEKMLRSMYNDFNLLKDGQAL